MLVLIRYPKHTVMLVPIRFHNKCDPDLYLLNCQVKEGQVVADTDDALWSFTTHTGSQPSIQLDDHQLIEQGLDRFVVWGL